MVSEPQSLKSGAWQLDQALESTANAVRQTNQREAWFTLAWRWLALLGLFFALDLVFGLPFWLRWLGLLAQFAFIGWSIYEARLSQSRLNTNQTRQEWAARVVEEQHPEVDNALINAVQFQRALGHSPAEQLPFMQREIARAQTRVAAVPVIEDINRAPEQKALKSLLWAAGAWTLLTICFFSGFRTVMPRLFAPWMDDLTPPWSLTHYKLSPRGASVSYGSSLNISVEVSGPVPKNLALMTKTAKTGWRAIALDSEEPGKYSLTLDDLREDTKFYVQGNGSRSARYPIHIQRPPVVKSVQATYTYPKYTKQPSSQETVREDGLHGLVNTRVRLEISTNRPLSGGQMTVETGEGQTQSVELLPDAKDPSRAVGDFSLIKPGTYAIALTADDGQANKEATKGKIKIDRDERPAVWIEQPGIDLLVTPDMKVPIQVSAEDDIGVQKVEMHRIVNDLGDNPHVFPKATSDKGAPKKVDNTLTMDLADLGVRPGDKISYYATAFDNDPGKPNIGETDPFTLKVVSPEEYREALREQRKPDDLKQETQDIVSGVQSLAQQQQKLAEKMAGLEKQLAKNPNDVKAQKQLAEARQQQKALQSQAEQMAQQLQQYAKSPSSTELEKTLKQKLGEVAQGMNKAATGPMQQAQSGQPGQSAQSAGEAAKQLAQMNQKMEQQVQKAVENLAKIAPLYNDLERFKSLLDQQGQLVLKAREFQDKNSSSAEDKARLEELAHQQNQIQQELKRVQEDLKQHVEECQSDFPKAAASARKIAGEIQSRQIPNSMQAGQDNFRQSQGPQGFENSARAFQQMQAMMGQCKSGQGNCEGELDISLSKSLGKSGLGKALSQLGQGSGMGQGQGQGGIGIGVSGSPSGQSGQQGGNYAMRTSKAFVPSVRSMSGSGGNRRQKHANQTPGTPAALSAEDIEVIPNATKAPSKASDTDSNRYPVEYKKLISDYFKSVAEGQ